MHKLQIFIVLVLIVAACGKPQEKKLYYKHVGDTIFDPEKDDPSFAICDTTHVFEYYNAGKGLQYQGEKPALIKPFENLTTAKKQADETGFITIRFIVNCEGKTGWFRVESMDNNFQAKDFNEPLVSELLQITKSLNGWIPHGDQTRKADYYQYLIFKIIDGQLVEILP